MPIDTRTKLRGALAALQLFVVVGVVLFALGALLGICFAGAVAMAKLILGAG